MLSKPLSYYQQQSRHKRAVSDYKKSSDSSDSWMKGGKKNSSMKFSDVYTPTRKSRSSSSTSNRTLPWIILALCLVFVLTPLMKWLRLKFKLFGKGTNDQVFTTDVVTTTQNSTIQGVNDSIDKGKLLQPDYFYEKVANDTYNALDGINWFGTPASVFESVQYLNKDELKMVYVYFNHRVNSGEWSITDTPKDIIGWYKGDLESLWEIPRMKNIWAKSGLPW